MNQQTPIKDRKQSLSRLSVISHSNKHLTGCSDKRKGASLTKKPAEIEQICEGKGKYLIGWGKLAFLCESTSKMQVINKDVTDFGCGQDHLVFANNQHQAFGIGKNRFGQLGNKDTTKSKEVIAAVFEDYKTKQVFCTAFCTFFITPENELYGCGLNNRGQLGTSSNEERVCSPTLIQTLSHLTDKKRLSKKQSRSKISSVYYQQLKKSISSKELIQEGQFQERTSSLLEANQYIADLRGGPFHTVVLTDKGRIFYTGNLYKAQSLLQDEFANEFIELNTCRFGKIVSLRSHLTGFGFLNAQGKLYLLGHFGQNLFNQPQPIDRIQVASFDLNDRGIYTVGIYGEAYFIDTCRQSIQIQRIPATIELRTVFCGLDYAIFVSKSNSLLGLGDNSCSQLGRTLQQQQQPNLTQLEFVFKPEQALTLRCSNNFVLTLATTTLNPIATDPTDASKLKDLQRQNKILKELLCNKNKKNAKMQTDKQSKFQFSKAVNARTFDTSMEIPFHEIKLGKQISEGGYGIIYKATWRKTTVAVKIFKIQQQSQTAVRDFISECHAMEALRHPNIVMFLGACTKPPHFAIVLEYCEGGTLWSLLQKQQELSWEQRRNLALEIARGMNYLHERPVPVLHRDLKSLNVLLDGSRRVKLADFGWTKGLQNYMTGKIGTYQWMAPQMISGFQYSQKADVYSFAIILWQIASRQAPYRNIPGPQVAQQVVTKELRPAVPKKTPACFSELMERCWSRNPASRPSFAALINELQEMRFN